MNAKKKGNRGENLFANWLTSQGITAYRNSGSGAGIAKSDVHNSLNANFEVKTVKKVNLMEFWKQSQRDADLTHTTPYLAIHVDGMRENEWLMVMNNYDWLEIIKKTIEAPTPQHPNRDLKYKVERARAALQDLLKTLE